MSRHSNRRAPRCGSSSTSRSAWTNWKPFASLLWTAFITTGRQSVWKSPGKHPGGSRKRHAEKWRGQSLKDKHSLTTEVTSLWKALEHFIVPRADTPGTFPSDRDDRTSVPSVTVTASGEWEPGVVPGSIPDEDEDHADKVGRDFAPETLNSYPSETGKEHAMAETKEGCVSAAAGVLTNDKAPAAESPTSSGKDHQMTARVGQKAPDFEASALVGGAFKNVKLSDYFGKWIVLCFYPGDFTFV